MFNFLYISSIAPNKKDFYDVFFYNVTGFVVNTKYIAIVNCHKASNFFHSNFYGVPISSYCGQFPAVIIRIH